MAAAQSVVLQQQSIIKLKNHSLYHSPQFPAHTSFSVNFNIRSSFTKLTVQSFSLKNKNDSSVTVSRGSNNGDFNKFGFPIKRNPVEIAAETLINALIRALQKSAAAAVILGLLVLTCDPNSAMAASGGRMGGSSFSSSSSSSSYSSSSGGYSSSSDDEDSSSSYYYSSSSLKSSSPSLSSTVAPDAESAPAESSEDEVAIWFLLFCVILWVWLSSCEMSEASITVLKLQVGLLGSAKSLQKDLNQIAEIADTSTTKGLHHILTESVLALVRYPEYCVSAFLSIDTVHSMKAAEQRFFKLSFEERGKLDEETLVNVNNIKKRSSTTMKSSGFSNEHIVVTILVTAREQLKVPSINSSKDLKEGLEMLGSLPLGRTLAVEVIWTPQREDDTLSEEELLEKYPLLRPLQ